MKIVSCLILAGFLMARVESTTTGDVRLVGGSSQHSGYVEVYYNGQWNTVCAANSPYDEGNVACKQLGYRLASNATGGHDYPGSSLDYITVNCYGGEDRMDECSIYSDCYSSSRLVVVCTMESTTTGDVRLVGGSSQHSGYVEVYYNGKWNTVCAEYSTYDEGNVACKQLGYRLASSATGGHDYPGSSLDSITVHCDGGEDRMNECSIDSDCYSSSRLVVVCTMGSTTTGDVRLVGGSSQHSGYVEVYYNGQWNTVCAEYSAYDESNVACKQLGYRLASRAIRGYDYPGSSSDSITVNCYGGEDRMDECSINSYCYSSSRLVVECTNVYTLLAWAILIPLICGLIVLCVLCVPCVVACCLYCKKKPRGSPVPGNTAEGTITSAPSSAQGGTERNIPPSPERPPDDDTHQYTTPRPDVNSGQRSGVQSSGVTQVPLEPLVSFVDPTEAESQNNENEPLLAQFD